MQAILKHWPLGLAVLLFGYLVVFQLDDTYLWQDEAETALVAQTIFKYGIPKGTDGVNFYSQQSRGELGENYEWKLHPWFQFYYLAPFLWILDNNAFNARFPFVLFGLACLILLYFFLYNKHRSSLLAAIGPLILLTSQTFLIMSGQVRYYAPAMFFTLAFLIGYRQFLSQSKYGLLLLGAAIFFLFHCHYIMAAMALGVANLHCLLFHRILYKRLFFFSLAFSLVHLPFILWIREAALGTQGGEATNFSISLEYYTMQFFQYLFTPLLLIPGILIILSRWLKRKPIFLKKELNGVHSMIFILFPVAIVGFALLTKENYMRYMIFLLPLVALMAADWSIRVFRIHKLLATASLLVVISAGGFHHYWERIHFEYEGPNEGLIRFLKGEAAPSDTIAANYGDLVLMYYLPNKVVGAQTGDSMSLLKDAKFIIPRQYVMTQEEVTFYQTLNNVTAAQRFRTIALDNVKDVPFETREDPSYNIVEMVKSEQHEITLLKRVK